MRSGHHQSLQNVVELTHLIVTIN